MAKPVKILQIVGSMHPGGIENFVMNLYQHIDREKFPFGFVVHKQQEGDYTEQIEEMGGQIYLLPRLTRHPIRNFYGIYRIVKDNHYDIVIRHTPNALIAPQLLAARLAGAHTICHSHSETDKQKLVHRLGKILLRIAAEKRIACSINAGTWMFGSQSYDIVHNAVDIEAFRYTKAKEEQIRNEFQLGNRHIYGHVGNFVWSKNHLLMLRIFKEIRTLDPEAALFFVGQGTMQKEIEEEIAKLNLGNSVILTGVRKDVPTLMSAFNVLLFPSVYEGLPLTLIEAQAAGLPCLISDTITPDVIVTEGLVKQYSLQCTTQEWAAEAVSMVRENGEDTRKCQRDRISDAGYDLDALTKWFEDYFTRLAGKSGGIYAGKQLYAEQDEPDRRFPNGAK